MKRRDLEKALKTAFPKDIETSVVAEGSGWIIRWKATIGRNRYSYAYHATADDLTRRIGFVPYLIALFRAQIQDCKEKERQAA